MQKAGRVRYWQYGQAEKSPDLAISDPSRFLPASSLYRGGAWYAKKEYDRVIADCDQAIGLDPKFAWAYNSRAWLWATCPDVKYRDGKKAVESATRACELTDRKEADYLDTLAAAYAEAGDFDAAVTWEENAQSLLANDDVRNRKDFEARLTLYKAKRAGDRSARAGRP